MLRVTTAALIAIMSTTAASAEGIYIGYGFASVGADEPGYKYNSINAIGMIGYEVNDYLSIEGELSMPISEDKLTIGSSTVDIGLEHIGAHAKLTLPTSGPIKPFARLGMIRGKAAATIGSTTVSVSDSALSYGFGAEWEFSERSGLRLDYTMTELDGDTDASVLALTSVYRF